MSKTKRIFAIAFVVFAILLCYASYDISKRTTFPGSKGQLKERIEKTFLSGDSAKRDSAAQKSPKN